MKGEQAGLQGQKAEVELPGAGGVTQCLWGDGNVLRLGLPESGYAKPPEFYTFNG